MMWTIAAVLTNCVLGAAPPAGSDHAVPFRALFPFIGSSTGAVVHLDLAADRFPALVDKIVGREEDNPLVEASRPLVAWTNDLRAAGARDLFIVLDLADFPVSPLAVVPLEDKADSFTISRLLSGGQGRPPFHFPECDKIHHFISPGTPENVIAAGTPEALRRARDWKDPELVEKRGPDYKRQEELGMNYVYSFGAIDEGPNAARLLLLLSPDNRRIIEETVPNLPRELGGGPITDLTKGLKWIALGIAASDKPSSKLVVGTSNVESAEKLQKIGRELVGLLGKTPAVTATVPDWDKLISMFHVEIEGGQQINGKITITADARTAGRIIEAIARPARATATRSQCTNNLKQIGLALHNHASAHKLTFPAAYTTDKAGKPLLSWRVAILPYIEQDALYKEFHLDEPWDSVHNRALIERMPPTYRCPGARPSDIRAGKTRYLAPRDKHSILAGTEGVELKQITDGTSNTIMVMDAGNENAVIWTRPDDWEPGDALKTVPADVFKAHGSPGASIGTNALFGDGSVHFLRDTIKPDLLRKLITRDGGEVVSSDDF